jgi:hypothetical protein
MSLGLNSKPGSDLEGDARESANLKVGLRRPKITRRPMIQTTDNELYLRTDHTRSQGAYMGADRGVKSMLD